MPNRRLLLCLGTTQALNASAMPISFIAGSLAAVSIAGNNGRFAGAPLFISLTTAAVITFFLGKKLGHWGYRVSLLSACLLGMAGNAMAAWGAWQNSLPVFLLAFAGNGAAFGLTSFARYAAAEISEPEFKGRAIGLVVLGSTLGAIAGPWLVSLGGQWAEALHAPKAIGPWVVAILIYALAWLNLFLFLKPDIRSGKPARGPAGPNPHSAWKIIRKPEIALTLLAGMSAQGAMAFIMSITPLHMHACHYPMTSISWVLSSHFLGMFGLSVLSGWLADKMGKKTSIAMGSVVLILSCWLAPRADSLLPLMLALFLLGWGWNLCFLGVSATLAATVTDEFRSRVQGVQESLINAASSLSSLMSGLAFATLGYGAMSAVGFALSVLPALVWLRDRRDSPPAKA